MRLQEQLQILTQGLGLPPVGPLDADRGVLLALAPELEVWLQELDPGVSFWAVIAPCPARNREALFLHLMKANFLGMGTGGGAIGLDREEKFLTLSHLIPYDMSDKALRDKLEDFVNFVEYWRAHVERHQQEAHSNPYG